MIHKIFTDDQIDVLYGKGSVLGNRLKKYLTDANVLLLFVDETGEGQLLRVNGEVELI